MYIKDSLYRCYLEFLRYCLDDTLPVPESSGKIDWMRMMDWAESQAIVGVIYGGIQKAGKTLNIPFDDLMEWIGYAQDIEERNKLLNRRCAEIVSAFQKDGYKTCILKGQGNAALYDVRGEKEEGRGLSLLRTPGDIDLLVLGHTEITDSTDNETNTNLTNDTNRETNTNCTNNTDRETNTNLTNDTNKEKSDSKLIKEIIRYVRKRNPGAKATYHHVEYGEVNGVEVEVHYRPSFMNNLIKNRRLQRWMMEEGRRMKEEVELPDGAGRIPVPSWEFNVVFQLSHIYRHVIQSGLGLRQMIDYFYLLQMRNEKGEMRNDNEELEMTLRELGLMEIAGAVMWVLGYLVCGERFMGQGCRKEKWMICEPDERRGRFLLDEIMEGGNFGMGLKPDAGWLGVDTAIGRNVLRLKRDARLLRYFPSECLWEPIFRLWHFGWRVVH